MPSALHVQLLEERIVKKTTRKNTWYRVTAEVGSAQEGLELIQWIQLLPMQFGSQSYGQYNTGFDRACYVSFNVCDPPPDND